MQYIALTQKKQKSEKNKKSKVISLSPTIYKFLTNLASLALTFLIPPPIALAGNGDCNKVSPATAVDPTILSKNERREDSSLIIDSFDVVLEVGFAIGAKAPTDAQRVS